MIALLALAAVLQQPPVSQAEFVQLHATVRKREPWQEVPWRTDLLDARAVAARDAKPLFIWAMDGQTLGCT